jgi:hypothetical protein
VPGGRDGRNGGVGPQRVSRPAESRDVRRWRIHGWIPRGVRRWRPRDESRLNPSPCGKACAGAHEAAWQHLAVVGLALYRHWEVDVDRDGLVVRLRRAGDKRMAGAVKALVRFSSKWTQNPTCKWPMLGGTYNLPHGDVHAAVLPYAMAFNRDAAPQAMSQVAAALGATDAAAGPLQLNSAVGAPKNLVDVGFDTANIDEVADIVAQARFPNPRPVTVQGVRALLDAASAGQLPQ